MIYNQKTLWDSMTFAMLLQIKAVATNAKEDNNEIMMITGIQTQDHRNVSLRKLSETVCICQGMYGGYTELHVCIR